MNTTLPQVLLKEGDMLHGFLVENITAVSEIISIAYRLKHLKSGARLIHLHSNDAENLLAIGFRTPPPDNTGLPHILEHTVLCGSAKYPVKDPFVELIRTSMATFLNAMTYPDRTVYPCASMNKKDFFNLADVYCDAVFHPLITEEHFKQEGHHFEFTEPGNISSRLTLKGVVYNEMKGALSDLDGIIEDNLRNLFPDNAYGLNSGGHPDFIPTLSYAQFKAFHARYYHPSNAFIFICGNIPTREHLAFLDSSYLSNFDTININTTIAEQPRWTQPRRETISYPIGPAEERDHKTAVTLSFLTNPVTAIHDTLAMNILSHYLLDNAASPLRKALIDSGLGQELTGSGYASDQRDTFFTVGLKGTEPEHAGLINDLILETCRKTAENGLDPSKLEAALHGLELASRAIGGGYPLSLMSRVYRAWVYDEKDPLAQLRLAECLAMLRESHKKNKRFFEEVLTRLIVQNDHRILQIYTPDPSLSKRSSDDFERGMENLKAAMTRDQLSSISNEACSLTHLQNQPNSPRALASLPRLIPSDIPPEPVPLSYAETTVAGRPFIRADMWSNDLCHINIMLDLQGISDELIDYLPLFTACIMKMGAGGYNYAEMAEREALNTGGVSSSVWAKGAFADPSRMQPFFAVSSFTLASRFREMLDIVNLRLTQCDFSDTARLQNIISQQLVHIESHLVAGGNAYAALRAQSHLTRNGTITERLGGISHLRFLRQLAAKFPDIKTDIISRLSAIHRHVLARERLHAGFLGNDPQYDLTQTWLNDLVNHLSPGTLSHLSDDFQPNATAREGMAIPAKVGFCARSTPLAISANHPLAPSLLVLAHILTFTHLWNEIRVKGGAYGCSAHYSILNGTFDLSTYRDPAINRSLSTFTRLASILPSILDPSPDAVSQAVIGAMKNIDHPIRPSSALYIATDRYLTGITPDLHRAFRTSLLSVTPDQLQEAATLLSQALSADSPICVLADRKALQQANLEPDSFNLNINDV